MNPDTTPGIDIENRGFRPLDDGRLFDLVREMQVAQDKFDEGQIVEAIKQALESGDFVKYIVAEPGPPSEAWNGMLRQIGMEPSGKYKFTTRSMVSYEPGREAARLREKIENAGRLIWVNYPIRAYTPFGAYHIHPCGATFRWSFADEDWDEERYESEDAVKGAAEADWACRLFDLLGGTL